jgi:hypothetical protein
MSVILAKPPARNNKTPLPRVGDIFDRVESICYILSYKNPGGSTPRTANIPRVRLMSKKEEIKGDSFVIKDKRSSQLSEEDASREPEPEAPPAGEPAPKQAPGEQKFQIDFSTFIMSLTSSAFYHLGDLADPVTGQKETNLPAVQQTIDMLIMLKAKTQGNLSADEAKLLEQLIYELQMKYVEKTRG